MLWIAQQTRMHEAEVGDIEKVFDHPRPLCAKKIRTGQHQANAGSSPRAN
jgi:hypothetical protein